MSWRVSGARNDAWGVAVEEWRSGHSLGPDHTLEYEYGPRDLKAILVAEDDKAARGLLKEVLSEVEGWFVTAVEDGAKLLELLDKVQPRLIVLDVNMPGVNGFEVYRLVRERTAVEVPVIFVTAEQPRRVGELDGTFRWLAKPFDVDVLIGTAADLLGENVGAL